MSGAASPGLLALLLLAGLAFRALLTYDAQLGVAATLARAGGVPEAVVLRAAWLAWGAACAAGGYLFAVHQLTGGVGRVGGGRIGGSDRLAVQEADPVPGSAPGPAAPLGETERADLPPARPTGAPLPPDTLAEFDPLLAGPATASPQPGPGNHEPDSPLAGVPDPLSPSPTSLLDAPNVFARPAPVFFSGASPVAGSKAAQPEAEQVGGSAGDPGQPSAPKPMDPPPPASQRRPTPPLPAPMAVLPPSAPPRPPPVNPPPSESRPSNRPPSPSPPFVPASPHPVLLLSPHGTLLRALPDGTLAHLPGATAASTFSELVPLPNSSSTTTGAAGPSDMRVAFGTAYGTFVSASGHSETRETWTRVPGEGGRQAFRSGAGKFLAALPGGKVGCVDRWEDAAGWEVRVAGA
ncbi:hypothetical protein DFJ74DRAFT_676192 [Hyaloraphidium curvatum]|nr:hypothetical protein DFJ74DRAFT_676192 [Hyaloraphidium curvatum]